MHTGCRQIRQLGCSLSRCLWFKEEVPLLRRFGSAVLFSIARQSRDRRSTAELWRSPGGRSAVAHPAKNPAPIPGQPQIVDTNCQKSGSRTATGRIQSRRAGDLPAAPSIRPDRCPTGPARPECGVCPTVGSRGRCDGSALAATARAASVRAVARRWRGIATSNGGRAGMPADASRRPTPAGR